MNIKPKDYNIYKDSKKKVLITGASKGIGKEIAKKLQQRGYLVLGTSRNPDLIEDKIPGITYLKLELSDKKSIEDCFKEIGEIDVLINNAGQSQLGSIEEITIEKFESLFKINLFGMVYLTKLFIPGMRQRRSGTIINIGSLGGRFALPYFSSYSSSKAAVLGFTQSLRYELINFGIKVVLVEPSDIKTSISPEFFTTPGSEYHWIAENVRASLWEAMNKADDPAVVAKKVISILYKDKPDPAYAVGGLGPLLVFLKRLLPDKFVERIIRKRYGI